MKQEEVLEICNLLIKIAGYKRGKCILQEKILFFSQTSLQEEKFKILL